MALFKINKGLAENLAKNMPYAKEGFAYFTKDDGKFYIDIDGDGTTTEAVVNVNRIPLNAAKADVATMIQATVMETDDNKVYPILAFNITDSTKNLVEAKQSQIGIKNGTLVIPSVKDKDEILISNEGLGRGIVIDNKGTKNAIEILNGKGIKVAQDPTENLELTTKQYVDNKLANKSNTGHNHDATYKKIQTAVSSPEVSTTDTDISFIDTISQDTQGKITATKKTVRDASASQSGVVSTGTQTFAGEKTLNNKTHFSKGFDLKTDSGNAQFNANTVSVNSGTDYVDLYVSTINGGNSNKTRPLVLNANSNGYGNVGIGITQPTEKLEVDGNVKAAQFKGNLDGNANTADSWKTARKLIIGSAEKEVDGSADVNWSLDDIGAAAENHTHDDLYYTETEIDTKLNALLGANDALVFKGIIDGEHPLPTTGYEVGHTYRVNTTGTYAGQKCEQGDLIICIADALSTSTPHWTVAQTNIDGAVIGPASAVNNHVAIFDGANGKVIKDSGFTIGKSVPSNAVFTDTHYTTHLYAGTGNAQNAATTNGNTKLTVADNDTVSDSVTIKGTGDASVTSDSNGNIIINSKPYSHPTSGVTAGTYKSVTVNAQGHVTAGTNPTTLAGFGITDAKKKQSAKPSPSTSGNALAFIDTISQNEQGVITATKKNAQNATETQAGVVSIDSQTFGGAKTFTSTVTIGKNGCTLQYDATNQCLNFVFA